MALDATELSPRELAVRFTDEKRHFVSEATVYRPLKAHDLITSPAYTVIKAANEFQHKTSRLNEMRQADFTYFRIIERGWMYLSPCSTAPCATSSPGDRAPPYVRAISPTRWIWLWRHRGSNLLFNGKRVIDDVFNVFSTYNRLAWPSILL